MTSDYYIGIDGGTTGGVAIIFGSTGGIDTLHAMPVKNGLIDGHALGSLLSGFNNPYDNVTVAIEACPRHSQSKAAMRSMAISFGIIFGVVCREMTGSRIVLVRAGNPKDSWQRVLLGTQPKGGTKVAALAKARAIWPDQAWPTKTPNGNVLHDGVIDAALIAHHVRNLDLKSSR